jgi:UDP-N-acetylglucosamine diphosphorylase/glucosamine-1-phosphate N-acetyltransferase
VTPPRLVLYDDATARTFAPFALTRPIAALRAGAVLIAERWQRAFGAADDSLTWISSPHLRPFARTGPPYAPIKTIAAGTVIANSRCVVTLASIERSASAWRVDGDIAAVRVTSPLDADALSDGTLELGELAEGSSDSVDSHGRWLRAPWDVIATLQDQLSDDVAVLADASEPAWRRDSQTGTHPLIVETDATVEPHVVFDTTSGAIVVQRNARIEAFSRVAGPCVIGPRTVILGGRISGSAIGEDCRVHGDVSASVFIGHANKAHEGFVGHSMIGRWANLGAGTTTSNLKNSYGPVSMWTPAGERNTGLTFLGSLIGDHAKLGIGTMLGTGSVVGAGANVFGSLRPPKRVPPFAWGDAPPYELFNLEKLLDVAARVQRRRGITFDSAERSILEAAHALARDESW